MKPQGLQIATMGKPKGKKDGVLTGGTLAPAALIGQ